MTGPDLREWNTQRINVSQALLGVPSPNFRRVTLDHDGVEWVITVTLALEDAEDREEIEDFGAEWDALRSRAEPCDVRTVVSCGALSWPDFPTRVIYQRQEAVAAQD